MEFAESRCIRMPDFIKIGKTNADIFAQTSHIAWVIFTLSWSVVSVCVCVCVCVWWLIWLHVELTVHVSISHCLWLGYRSCVAGGKQDANSSSLRWLVWCHWPGHDRCHGTICRRRFLWLPEVRWQCSRQHNIEPAMSSGVCLCVSVCVSVC